MKYKRTVKLCREWTKECPGNPEAWYQLCSILRFRDGKPNKEFFPEIFISLNKGLAACNGHGDVSNIQVQILNLMGWVKHANGDHGEALGYGKKALAIKSDYLDAILLVGMAYTYGVNAREGEQWLQRYLREQEAYQFSDKLDGIVMERLNDRALTYRTLADIEDWKVGGGKNTQDQDPESQPAVVG